MVERISRSSPFRTSGNRAMPGARVAIVLTVLQDEEHTLPLVLKSGIPHVRLQGDAGNFHIGAGSQAPVRRAGTTAVHIPVERQRRSSVSQRIIGGAS